MGVCFSSFKGCILIFENDSANIAGNLLHSYRWPIYMVETVD